MDANNTMRLDKAIQLKAFYPYTTRIDEKLFAFSTITRNNGFSFI
jgi:hypothetical protein